jgi:hypothetical protein
MKRSLAIATAAMITATLVLAVLVSGANAQYRGTPAMQLACTPDVMRLCSTDIPDVEKITACMMRNRIHLSAACGAVFGVRLSRGDQRRP